jgi:predicted metallo-beta-lactamase superfamily hydrolase
MPVPDDGSMKKTKHIAHFGQLKMSSENIVVIDGPLVYLLQFKFECCGNSQFL